MKKLLIIPFFLITIQGSAQKIQVNNIRAEQQGENIVIFYDIEGAEKHHRFDVILYYSTDVGKSFNEKIIDVDGDTGFNIPGGKDKKVTWRVLEEIESLVSDDVIIKVRAESIDFGFNEMILVEGAQFIMGNNMGGEDEKAEHNVRVIDFYIGKYEVTVEQYRNYCKASDKEMPENKVPWIDNHPITYVSWYDVVDYCNWLTEITGQVYRLPTEAEWEYTANGGKKNKGLKYSGSNDINEVAWYHTNSGGYSHVEVGKLLPNELGLYDIYGNVWEWCMDWYGKGFYSISSSDNPQGPPSGKVKVARGGSWREQAKSISKTFRFFMTPTASSNYMGFRIAREL